MNMVLDESHDPRLTSWVETAQGHADFPIQNLPLGVFSPSGGAPRIGVAIGDMILDLKAAAEAGLLPEWAAMIAREPLLNSLLGQPAQRRIELRRTLSLLLSREEGRAQAEPLLHEAAMCEMRLPAAIGDYTDFYVGIRHAENIGRLFRPDNPLLPNYKYVPIGYHGRASSIRVSGAPVVRPKGQTKAPDATAPQFGPCRRLDYELELGVWIGAGNALGRSIPIGEAHRSVAGLCLLNDWSARDVQAWEYQPLGPFLSKNFQTTITPWIVTIEALAPYRVAQRPRPEGDPQPLPYLWDAADQAGGAFSIVLEAALSTEAMRKAGAAPFRLSRGTAQNMYWTVAQMVAHHASGGCNLNPADLLGTGTISGDDRSALGSLLEISRGGTEPVTLPTGETRCFLEDGDEVIFAARAEAEGRTSIGFGQCRGIVLPAEG